jgi:hypothetical protein
MDATEFRQNFIDMGAVATLTAKLIPDEHQSRREVDAKALRPRGTAL